MTENNNAFIVMIEVIWMDNIVYLLILMFINASDTILLLLVQYVIRITYYIHLSNCVIKYKIIETDVLLILTCNVLNVLMVSYWIVIINKPYWTITIINRLIIKRDVLKFKIPMRTAKSMMLMGVFCVKKNTSLMTMVLVLKLLLVKVEISNCYLIVSR